jgi:hypothetical protein
LLVLRQFIRFDSLLVAQNIALESRAALIQIAAIKGAVTLFVPVRMLLPSVVLITSLVKVSLPGTYNPIPCALPLPARHFRPLLGPNAPKAGQDDWLHGAYVRVSRHHVAAAPAL